MIEIYQGDNLKVLAGFADGSFPLVYIDPPFNTGRKQARRRMKNELDPEGDRTGFGGKRYRTKWVGGGGYEDRFDDYLEFLRPRMEHAFRVLAPTGSLFFHIDCRESHYCKVMLDGIFGRECFMNEIVWAYDYGARSKSRWSSKHDTIFWYVRDPKRYTFNYDAIDRIPYMAPEMVTPEKAARGKTPTDVWWNTIVSPTGKEKTGYPTQKPLAILRRIVRVHSNPGDRVLDFFAGSGTTGAAAELEGRDAVLVDSNVRAVETMVRRLPGAKVNLQPHPLTHPHPHPHPQPHPLTRPRRRASSGSPRSRTGTS
jgi:site-specific DNA-methyltransferase (adenine-specific)